MLKVPDMIHNITPTHFFQTHSDVVGFFSDLCVEIWLSIPNTLVEINMDGNVAWKLENMVTTLNKTINNISTIFSY